MHPSRFFTILGFILFGILSRFLPYPPNFTAINSIALFSAFSFANLRLSLCTVFITMFCSDLILGLHSTMLFVYVSFGLIIWMGHWCKINFSTHFIPLCVLASSLLFFIITNFGVWLTSSFYPKTFAGLKVCYLAAIPFLSNQILGDLMYSALIFGCFAIAKYFIPSIRPLPQQASCIL